MNKRKFKYKMIKELFVHDVLETAEGLEGWEMVSVIKEIGHYVGILKKRIQ